MDPLEVLQATPCECGRTGQWFYERTETTIHRPKLSRDGGIVLDAGETVDVIEAEWLCECGRTMPPHSLGDIEIVDYQ
ncbi:MAG: hypothetical protein ACOC5K_01050 [Chloroflexota bacterium]